MPPKAKANKSVYQMAPPIPSGHIITDFTKRSWSVGKAFAQGGFGAIYSVSNGANDTASKASKYVLKIEPKNNGPLFVEINFYQRAAKQHDIDEFKLARKLDYLGVPAFVAAGCFEFQKSQFRFLIMPRFGSDVQKKLEMFKSFPATTVFQMAKCLINCLEYIHHKDFTHSDIKGANVLLSDSFPNQIYLADFGLAFRYAPDGVHKPYKADPRRAHDGTIEYTSRDAHAGATPSRRSDLEILGYVLLHWSSGTLPWLDKLDNKEYVAKAKEKFMNAIPSLVSTCFNKRQPRVADTLKTYLKLISDYSYLQQPDYDKLRAVFHRNFPIEMNAPLQFSSSESPTTPITKRKKNLLIKADAPERQQVLNPCRKSPRLIIHSPQIEEKEASVQTSPWLYEKFREDRRMRRRLAKQQ